MQRLLAVERVTAESRYAQVGSIRLHYLECGQGPAVVLLQGAGGGAANWYRLFGELGRTARVLALDLPGFGMSERMEAEAPLGRSVARIIEQWLDVVGVERCAIVATSFGSLAALRLGLLYPGRVSRLAVLNGVGLGTDLPLAVRLASLPMLGTIGTKASRRGTLWLLRRLLTRPGWRLPPEHEAALVDYLYESAAAGDPAYMAKVMRMFGRLRGQREILDEQELAQIEMPVLLVWGALDPFLPPDHGRAAAAALPRSVLHLLPGTGHSPNWESPREVLRVLVPFLAARHAS
jgi:2-hydroxymuconate-semialdehyde hydrolase